MPALWSAFLPGQNRVPGQLSPRSSRVSSRTGWWWLAIRVFSDP